MCDYSLEAIKSRPARIGDELVTHAFFGSHNFGTVGFRAADDPSKGAEARAVCLRPGTEVKFEGPLERLGYSVIMPGRWDRLKKFFRAPPPPEPVTATFTKRNPQNPKEHHDGFLLANGRFILINDLRPGQRATVLTIPAIHKKADELVADRKRRVLEHA